MRIFLTGATGYIGSAVAAVLVRAGHKVTGLTHSPEKANLLEELGVTPAVGDIKKAETYRSAADACEVLIHAAFEYSPQAAAADRAAVEALVASAREAKKPRSLIYTSGVWVLGRQSARPADEGTPLNPIPAVSWRPAHEKLVLEAGGGSVAAAVLRPGCVYGERGGLYGMMFDSAQKKREVRVIGGGRNRWAAVYLDDLAELYRILAEKRAGGVFHATDGSSDTHRDVAEAILDAEGGGSVEDATLDEARRVMGPLADGWAIDQLVASPRALALGWKPVMSSPRKNAMKLLMQWREQLGPASVA